MSIGIRFYLFAVLIFAAALLPGCEDNKEKSNDLANMALLAGASGSGGTGGLPVFTAPGVVGGMAVQSQLGIQIGTSYQYTLANYTGSSTMPAPPEFESSGPSSLSVSPTGAILTKTANFTLGINMDFTGPDVSGWYTQYYTFGEYHYTWKYRTIAADHALEYIFSIEASGSGSSYSYEVHVYAAMNSDGLITGYCDTTQHGSGTITYSVRWNYLFTGWDPATGAGSFDWYWSANSSGVDPVFYHRALNITATDNHNSTLHKTVTWYNDSGVEVDSFAYDTLSYETTFLTAYLFGY